MHTFTVDWTSEYIAFELDGEEHLRKFSLNYNFDQTVKIYIFLSTNVVTYSMFDIKIYQRLVPKDHGGFWKWGDFEGDMPGISNPWESGDKNMAPFDSHFYLIMNLAIGGATDYWSDDFNYGNRKPWRTDSTQVFI